MLKIVWFFSKLAEKAREELEMNTIPAVDEFNFKTEFTTYGTKPISEQQICENLIPLIPPGTPWLSNEMHGCAYEFNGIRILVLCKSLKAHWGTNKGKKKWTEILTWTLISLQVKLIVCVWNIWSNLDEIVAVKEIGKL